MKSKVGRNADLLLDLGRRAGKDHETLKMELVQCPLCKEYFMLLKPNKSNTDLITRLYNEDQMADCPNCKKSIGVMNLLYGDDGTSILMC